MLVSVFLLILNQIEFRLIQNRNENCHYTIVFLSISNELEKNFSECERQAFLGIMGSQFKALCLNPSMR